VNEELEGLLQDEFNRLRGRVLGLIESWGLPERQENGCKTTFKSLTYDSEAAITELVDAALND
jgi:hypothetical protein